jgi:hypothetical protein
MLETTQYTPTPLGSAIVIQTSTSGIIQVIICCCCCCWGVVAGVAASRVCT